MSRAAGGRAAWSALSRGEGTVLAAFSRCLYLDAGDALCCVGGEDLPEGPLNLRIASFIVDDALVTQCDARWRYRHGALSIGGQTWRLRVQPEWRPALAPAPEPGAVLAGLHACRDAARARAPAAPGPSSLERLIAAELEAASEALRRWLCCVAHSAVSGPPPDTALRLLGCGPGLTPSGDDCLVGVLVALQALRRDEAARALGHAVMAHAPQRTSRISAAHLRAACEGEAVAPVHDVLETLLAGNAPACTVAVRRLLAYGQHSGVDALAGIALAVGAVTEPPPGAGTPAQRRCSPPHPNPLPRGGEGDEAAR